MSETKFSVVGLNVVMIGNGPRPRDDLMRTLEANGAWVELRNHRSN